MDEFSNQTDIAGIVMDHAETMDLQKMKTDWMIQWNNYIFFYDQLFCGVWKNRYKLFRFFFHNGFKSYFVAKVNLLKMIPDGTKKEDRVILLVINLF